MNNTQLINYKELQNADSNQIVKVFDQSVEVLRNTAEKIEIAQYECKVAQEEVSLAKDCDFKRSFWFDDTTKAVEYLQDACVALAKSQISTKDAMDCLYQYQIVSTKMMSALIVACGNNMANLNTLQSRVDEYLKSDYIENEEVTNTLIDFRSRLDDSCQKLLEIETLRQTIDVQKNELSKLNGNTSKTSNSVPIILALLAVVVGIAAILGLKI